MSDTRTLLNLVHYIDQGTPTMAELVKATGLSPRQIRRYLDDASEIGVEIRCNRNARPEYYVIGNRDQVDWQHLRMWRTCMNVHTVRKGALAQLGDLRQVDLEDLELGSRSDR